MSAHPATTELGTPIRGPSAFGGSAGRFLHLTLTLAVTEFKLRFFGSVLGYLWQVVRPLMLFGVLLLVFTQFVDVGDAVHLYPAVLLTGVILYTFFAEATGGAVQSVVDRENLVRRIQFPRLAIPMAVVLTAIFNLGLNLLILLAFILALGVDPRAEWFEVPLLLGALTVLISGVAMLLSTLYVRFRDVKPIWDVALQVIFYASPVLYAIETIPSERIQHLLMLSPLGAILQQMRHAVIDPGAPTAAQAAGGTAWLLIPVAVVIGLFALGLWLFNREAPRIAEEL
jgi:ABC-2 type transport system permease protein